MKHNLVPPFMIREEGIQVNDTPKIQVNDPTTSELGPIEATHYQSLIGILHWIIELGRVDICLEVSMMSSHLTLPRVGHLQHLLQTFDYLKEVPQH